MNKDRLLKLAAYLETVPSGHFNMKEWVNKPATKPEGKKPGECGFSGCAVGWAAHGKLFRGLKFEQSTLLDGKSSLYPTYQNLDGFDAVEKLFDISEDDAERLFGSDRKGTPKEVAKRIRSYIQFVTG